MKTVDIKIGASDDLHHKCEQRIEGEWIVFTCPKCPSYERRINQRTDEMTSQGVGFIQHSGTYVPRREMMH